MTFRHLIRAALFLAVTSVAVAAPPAAIPAPGVSRNPALVAHYYTMTARLRPLLFWMTYENVGGARISWTGSPPDEQIQLLIGSDPDQAPMGVNRWGFIEERTEGSQTQIEGIMTETDETAIDAARANAASIGASVPFRSIRGTLDGTEATSTVSHFVVPARLTYRDYASLMQRVPVDGTAQRLRVAPGTDPGFLMAVRRVVDAGVGDWQQRRRVTAPVRRRYVYSGKTYQLSLLSASYVKSATVKGRDRGPALQGEFQILNPATGFTAGFTMLIGLAADNVGVPLTIIYRPRWWVEIQLDLVDPYASSNTFAMRIDGTQ